MSLDRKYLIWALSYAVAGMGLGIFMAASHNHAQTDTHSHILLAGFVVSLIYGVIHKLWLVDGKITSLAKVQFVVHQAGAIVLSVGLLLLYGDVFPAAQLDPILAISSIAVLLGALLMLIMVFKANRSMT
jgi:hypothetical protein